MVILGKAQKNLVAKTVGHRIGRHLPQKVIGAGRLGRIIKGLNKGRKSHLQGGIQHGLHIVLMLIGNPAQAVDLAAQRPVPHLTLHIGIHITKYAQ